MMKSSLLLVGAMALFAHVANAEEAAIAVDSTPLKASASMTAKALTNLTAGTKVNKLAQKGDWAQVEVTDESGAVQKGFVRSAALTSNKSVMSKIGTGKRINVGSAKDALGAAGKGKTEASAEAMDGLLAAADSELPEDASELGVDPAYNASNAKASSKGSGGGALDRLDAIKIGDAELMAFMKSGGLKSRILK